MSENIIKINKEGKEGSLKLIFIVMFVSILIASFWNRAPFIKNSVSIILNPTAGTILNWNLTFGMIILIGILSLFMTLIQKYTTDQKTLKEMKEEQKRLQQEMKKFEVGSKRYTELSVESMKLVGPMLKMGMRSIVYTAIPIILLFRWFMDYFSIVNFKFWIFNWFWFYFVATIIFSSVFRKILNVV